VASQVEAGHVAIVPAPWNRAFLEELRDFPFGTHDDQVDALARAFNTLESEPVSAVRSQVYHMIR
jgi:predicted phage terminase large subunit-like protein